MTKIVPLFVQIQNGNYSLYCIRTTPEYVETWDKCPEVAVASWDGWGSANGDRKSNMLGFRTKAKD